MRKDITVAAQSRDTRGKNAARRLRVQNQSPAVLYGAGKPAVAVAVSPKDLSKILHSSSGHNTIFNLDVQGVENTPVMIKETQNDPVTARLLHADLLRIDLSKRIVVKVEVKLHGEPKGVKIQGGTLEVVSREIEIECLPDDIPEHLDAEIGDMMVGGTLRAGEIALTGSMKLVQNPELVVAHVVGAKAEAAAEGAEGEKTAEPEVIKKGKKEAEGGEGDKKAAPKKK